MASSSSKPLILVLVLVALAIGVWGFLNLPDQRSTGQRIGDAIDTLPKGPDKAAEQLERRTPGEKLGDAVKDTGDDIKKSTSQR